MAALYVGEVADLGVIFFAARRSAAASEPQTDVTPSVEVVTLYAVFRFAWPLALREMSTAISRPMINLWVVRSINNGTEELAVLIIVLPLMHVAYGWLNELKNVAAAFTDDATASATVKPFYAGSMAFSLILMVVLAWLPVGRLILENLIGVDPALADQCIGPMRLFTLWPPAVALRSYCQGKVLCERRTEALAAAGPLRALFIALALQFFTECGETLFPSLRPSMAGILCLCFGFWTEALTCALCLYCGCAFTASNATSGRIPFRRMPRPSNSAAARSRGGELKERKRDALKMALAGLPQNPPAIWKRSSQSDIGEELEQQSAGLLQAESKEQQLSDAHVQTTHSVREELE